MSDDDELGYDPYEKSEFDDLIFEIVAIAECSNVPKVDRLKEGWGVLSKYVGNNAELAVHLRDDLWRAATMRKYPPDSEWLLSELHRRLLVSAVPGGRA